MSADGDRRERDAETVRLADAIKRLDGTNALEAAAAALQAGADPNGTSPARPCSGTMLSDAVTFREPALVALLLEHGADPDGAREELSILEGDCEDAEIARLVISAGIDPRRIGTEALRRLTGAISIPEATVPSDDFAAARHPRPGNANPEPVSFAFWRQMIRTGLPAHMGHETFGGTERPFDLCAPVWSHRRFGMSTTALPDGRWVQVAGEHEDWYDPDFHIYNDVAVLDGRGSVEVFLYPEDIFPPTDFHSATFAGDRLILIGNLGYGSQRRPGVTQVLSLSLTDFSITPVATTGEAPGWISDHDAILEGAEITVSGGRVWTGDTLAALETTHALSLATNRWRKL
ncbi:MAG: hypothetical protein AAF762_14480 [Pseudomonadota bacterium]